MTSRALVIGDTAAAIVATTRQCIADFYPDVLAAAELPAELPACALVVVVVDVYDNRISTWLQVLRAAAVPVLVIAVEPGEVWLAPAMLPTHSGCFSCFKEWLHNNIRQSHHWSAQREPLSDLRRAANKPLITPVLTVLGECLRRRLRDIANDVADAQRVVRLQTDSLRVSHHPLISYPQCPVCDQRPDDSAQRANLQWQPRLKRDPADFRAVNPALSVTHLRRRFVDRWTGLVKHVFHSINSDLMPLYAAETPILFDPNVEVGYGRTETRERSEMVAILEALERFAGQTARGVKQLPRGSYSQLRSDAVNPQDFVLHGTDQAQLPGFNLLPYSEELEYNWKWAYSLRSERPVLVPEQLVYYWLKPESAERPINRFVYDSSNGCALGGSVEEATLYGLLELAERDAYFTAWYARIPPKQIDLDGLLDERIRTLVGRSKAQGYELYVFDIRLDIDIPVVWAMIVDPAADAPVKSYCAAGAHFDPEQAIFGALVEVTTSMGVYRRSLPQFRERAYELLRNPNQVQQMNDHVLLYSLPETYEQLAFLFAGDGRKYTVDELYSSTVNAPKNADLTDDLRQCINKILQVAKDVIVVDLSFDQLQQAGLSCVKVLAPGLSPVTFGHQYRRPSLARINRVLAQRQPGRELTLAELNSFPHNFP